MSQILPKYNSDFSAVTRGFAYYPCIEETAVVSVTSITQSAGVAEVTTAAAHGKDVGDKVVIFGATPAAYNGLKTITSISQANNSIFYFAIDSGTASPATGTITYRDHITLTNLGNTGSAGMEVLDTTQYPFSVSVPGYFDCSGDTTDTAAAWDSNTALCNMLNIWSGATNGVGGRSLLVTFDYDYQTSNTGVVISSGSSGTDKSCWKIQYSTTALNLINRIAGLNNTHILANHPATRNQRVAVWLDSENGDIQLWFNGTPSTITGDVKTAVLGHWDDQGANYVNTVTLFANNTNTAAGEPTLGSTAVDPVRCVGFWDTTGLSSAQVGKLVDEIAKAPSYTIPQYWKELV